MTMQDDKTQDMLNHMAKVRIEAEVARWASMNALLTIAETRNKLGITMLQQFSMDKRSGVAFAMASLEPKPTVH